MFKCLANSFLFSTHLFINSFYCHLFVYSNAMYFRLAVKRYFVKMMPHLIMLYQMSDSFVKQFSFDVTCIETFDLNKRKPT